MSILNRKRLAAPAAWAAAALASVAHVIVLALALNLLPMDLLWWMVPLLIVAPGILSMTVLPGGWKRWYRWAALLGLALTVLEGNTSPFLIILVGETWMLHRAWVTERTAPVRDLLRRKPQEPLSGPQETVRPSRSTKPA